MYKSCPFCICCSSDRCEKCSYTCTDILTKKDKCSTVKPYDTAYGKCLKYSDRSGRRLYYRSKYHTHEYSDNRVFNLCKHIYKLRLIGKRFHCGTHHVHTDEQNTKTGEYLTDMFKFFIFLKYNCCYTYKCKKRGNGTDIKCNELSCDCSSNICSHYYPGCLFKIHYS